MVREYVQGVLVSEAPKGDKTVVHVSGWEGVERA